MSRCGLWFGTEQRMQWIETPLSGAASTPESWRAGNVLLNGGASVTHSWDSHKLYNYSWRNSSARQAAQLMKSYRDGSYGRGLIYFVDPLIYDTNVLPARWADPSIVADYEGPSHVTGVDAELVSLSAPASSGFPLNGVRYDLNGVIPGYRPEDSVFIPIPEGYKLWLGSYYSYTGSGGVFYAPVTNGIVGAITRVPPLDPNESVIHNFMVPETADGIRLFVGRQAVDPSSVTLGGMSARIVDAATSVAPQTPPPVERHLRGPWIGGQGHSGCRFDTDPTYIEYNGVNGGQVGYGATFREVGSWV